MSRSALGSSQLAAITSAIVRRHDADESPAVLSRKTDEFSDLLIPVFLYGSLMAPDILGHALGSSEVDIQTLLRPTAATMRNYRRYQVIEAAFPAMVPATNNIDDQGVHPAIGVSGILVWLRTKEDAEALDTMEKTLYTRKLADVIVVEDGRSQKAYVYVWKGGRSELSDDEWDFDEYMRKRPSARQT